MPDLTAETECACGYGQQTQPISLLECTNSIRDYVMSWITYILFHHHHQSTTTDTQ